MEEQNLLDQCDVAQYLILVILLDSEQMQRINDIDYRVDILDFPIVLGHQIVELQLKILSLSGHLRNSLILLQHLRIISRLLLTILSILTI